MSNKNSAVRNQIGTTQSEVVPETADLMKLPPWLEALRESMGDAIKGDDLKDIMKAQIDKAKGGDRSAAQFVFNQANKMIREHQKPVTIVLNNFYGEERPDAGAAAEPGTNAKVRTMQARVAARLPVAIDKDTPEHAKLRVASDEEEKQLRRAQEESEAA